MTPRKKLLQFRIVGNAYVLVDGRNRIKLGFSINPIGRRRQCQTGNGDQLRLVAVIPGITEADEKRLHRSISWRCRVAPKDHERTEWYWNGQEIWTILKKFAKEHRTWIVMMQPEQPDLFGDEFDSEEGQRAG